MKNQKGQITIFIIMGIILVVGVAIFFYARSQISITGYPPGIKNVYGFVEKCIEETGDEVVYDIGAGGGYYFPPEFSTSTGVPIYYSEGKNYMPSKSQIEEEISNFVEETLFFCTRNFVDFPELEITQREIKAETSIRDEEVILKIDYPISITKARSTIVLKEFKDIKIPVRFGVVYDSVKQLNEQSVNESICLSCALDIALKNDLYVNMMDYGENTTIFIFRDENSVINNKTFNFIFANQYKRAER